MLLLRGKDLHGRRIGNVAIARSNQAIIKQHYFWSQYSATERNYSKKTTPKKDITVKTEKKSQKKTASPTAVQTTQTLKTNPTTSTKPILTDDIESQLIELFVQKHSVELQDIEDRHSVAINAIDKESSDFEVYYFVRVKQINEKYANMGLTGSGPHNSELRALENKRADIANRRNAEIERYKKEKDALIQLITSEMQQYIDENFVVK